MMRLRCRGILAAFVLFLLWWKECVLKEGANALDLVQATPSILVHSVEATQAIQNPAHDAPLVARRSLTVRVFLEAVDGGSPAAQTTLRVIEEATGVVLHDLAQVSTVPPAVDRLDPSTSVNFEIPAPTALVEGTNVRLIVATMPQGGGVADEWEKGFGVKAPLDLRIRHVRIDYLDKGAPESAAVASGMADAFLRATFPVDDDPAGSLCVPPSPDDLLDFGEDENENGKIDPDGDEAQLLMVDLNDIRNKTVAALGAAADDAVHTYGWLPDECVAGNGAAPYCGRVGWGTTDPKRAQRTLAHEIAHNRGLLDTGGFVGEVGWDTGARLFGNPVENLVDVGSSRVKAGKHLELMDAGKLTFESWIGIDAYRCLLDGCGATPTTIVCGEFLSDAPTVRVACVSGVLSRDGARVAIPRAVFRYGWRVTPSRSAEGAPYRVRLALSNGGEAFAGFDGRVEGLVARDPLDASKRDIDSVTRHGFFEVRIPVREGVEITRLTVERRVRGAYVPIEAEDSTWVAAEFVPRDDADEVRVEVDVEPVELTEPVEVAWRTTLRGAEFLDRPLPAQLAFSPDGGRSWVPVGPGLVGTSRLVVDPARLPPSAGNGILRVHVSDGLRTYEGNREKLTVR